MTYPSRSVHFYLPDKSTPTSSEQYIIMGELALDGALRPIKGVLPSPSRRSVKASKRFILPIGNAREGAIVGGLEILPVRTLLEAVNFSYRSNRRNIAPLSELMYRKYCLLHE